MWAVAVATLNRFVGDEPGVAAAPHAFGGGAPAGDVRLILVGHAEGQTVQRCDTRWREMEHELMAVVHVPVAVDWLVVPDREVASQACSCPGGRLIDGNRLHPVDDVLETEM